MLPKSMRADNQTLIECDIRDTRQKYFLCLHIVYAYKEGRLREFEKCKAKIDQRICPALLMRVDEQRTKKEYYIAPQLEQVEVLKPKPKSSQADKTSESYLRGFKGPN